SSDGGVRPDPQAAAGRSRARRARIAFSRWLSRAHAHGSSSRYRSVGWFLVASRDSNQASASSIWSSSCASSVGSIASPLSIMGRDGRTRTGQKGETMSDDRYERGWARLTELAGTQGERVIEGLKDVAPDLARYVVEFGYGDVYSRSGLGDRERQLIAIATLTALGG